MKCDHLIGRTFDGDVYILASDVMEAVEELKEFAEDACLERDDNQTAIDELEAENAKLKNENLSLKAKNIELQSFFDLHGNVDNYIDKVKAENTELKAKLENVQANMYCDVVDANMEVRRLKKAEEYK